MSSGAPATPAIQVMDVVKVFDGGVVRALDGVSLEVAPLEFVAITGPSGCGKSTLLHLIAALDHPTSGTIIVHGRDLRMAGNERFRRREVGLVFQLHNLLPNLTALENIEVAMFSNGMTHREQRARAAELLGSVGLGRKGRTTPPRLSGGERQRLALARALANRPSIILADEPTGSLDSTSVEMVLDLLRAIREQQGVTIVLVTHDAHVAEAADRVIRMRDGHVVAAVDAPPSG
ncbi:MAG TPA: ABC transporter ATP-binding protein [Dehalococcoidia bacterium]|nr:ABC transporter ATP-binding protein [Dehalococcoidia bacterium]